jgi:hypothetical protein
MTHIKKPAENLPPLSPQSKTAPTSRRKPLYFGRSVTVEWATPMPGLKLPFLPRRVTTDAPSYPQSPGRPEVRDSIRIPATSERHFILSPSPHDRKGDDAIWRRVGALRLPSRRSTTTSPPQQHLPSPTPTKPQRNPPPALVTVSAMEAETAAEPPQLRSPPPLVRSMSSCGSMTSLVR